MQEEFVIQFPPRFVPLTEFIARNAQWYPEKTAVCCMGRKITWSELNQRINRFANSLVRSGISRGHPIAVLCGNCLEYLEILFGILKSGGIAVPVSTLLSKDAILLQLQHARPEIIISQDPFADTLDDILAQWPLMVSMQRIHVSENRDGWIRYPEFCSNSPATEPEVELSGGDLYNIIYSSGTTGNPKGILHSHQARLFLALTCSIEFRIHNEAVTCIATPMYSNGTQLTFLPTVLTGGTVVIMPSFDPGDLLRLIQEERCTHIFMVPTQFIRTMAHPEFNRCDTSSVEILLSAAAPLRKETKIRILEKFPASGLVELYGLTEGISTVLRPDEQLSKSGSVGKPRLGGDIKIIDVDGTELPQGETGEIAGFNFSMMKGYFKDPKATRDAIWQDKNGRMYLKTGDIGRLDADGYLYLLDRKKDLIISGGMNIYPSDIEEIIMKHPEVAEAAVLGIHHHEWGESPAAVVVKKNPESSLTRDALKNWTNSRLSTYQKLSYLEFRESLPRNDLGKILKRELRESLRNPASEDPTTRRI